MVGTLQSDLKGCITHSVLQEVITDGRYSNLGKSQNIIRRTNRTTSTKKPSVLFKKKLLM